MAGTEGDLFTAKEWLYLLQRELAIAPPVNDPIFDAGSPESQDAIYSITKPPQRHWPHPHVPGHGQHDYDAPHPPPPVHQWDVPRAWIDVYYPILNSPINASVQVVGKKGKVLWEADLKEHADEKDPEAAQYSNAIPTFHGLSKGGNVTGKVGRMCSLLRDQRAHRAYSLAHPCQLWAQGRLRQAGRQGCAVPSFLGSWLTAGIGRCQLHWCDCSRSLRR
jgi:hypothetical protein